MLQATQVPCNEHFVVIKAIEWSNVPLCEIESYHNQLCMLLHRGPSIGSTTPTGDLVLFPQFRTHAHSQLHRIFSMLTLAIGISFYGFCWNTT